MLKVPLIKGDLGGYCSKLKRIRYKLMWSLYQIDPRGDGENNKKQWDRQFPYPTNYLLIQYISQPRNLVSAVILEINTKIFVRNPVSKPRSNYSISWTQYVHLYTSP